MLPGHPSLKGFHYFGLFPCLKSIEIVCQVHRLCPTKGSFVHSLNILLIGCFCCCIVMYILIHSFGVVRLLSALVSFSLCMLVLCQCVVCSHVTFLRVFKAAVDIENHSLCPRISA